MTKIEFKKQLEGLRRQMMLANTGFASVADWEKNSGDFEDCQTEEEEAQWEKVADLVAKTNDWINEVLYTQSQL